MTGMIAALFAIIFFALGGIVIGTLAAWIFYGLGKKHEAARYGKASDFKKVEKTTYEKK